MSLILETKKVIKRYGIRDGYLTKALDEISITIKKGEFVGIMGPSGSGKTTLLNCISTIDQVDAGKIIIKGQDLADISEKEKSKFRRLNLGFIFQDFNLLDTLTIYENIALAMTINRIKYHEINKRVLDIAEKLDIMSVLNQFPYQVSGGQKQKCACARAVINNPGLILADEPTGSLDSQSSRMLMDTVMTLNSEYDATILMVTHDAFTASYARRILFLKDGKIFTEIDNQHSDRKQFFNSILDICADLGGDLSNVR